MPITDLGSHVTTGEEIYLTRPKLTHLRPLHTNPKRKRGRELRPRLHFGLVSVSAA